MVVALLGFASIQPMILPSAEGFPSAKPEEVGMSSERLNKIKQTLQQDIDNGTAPGGVLLIARHGKIVFYEAFGYSDVENKVPMQKDSMFSLASMTKPIAASCIMMLVEEGKINLNDPISKYLPAFKDMKVGVENDASGGKTLDLMSANKPITILDLLRSTAGFTVQLLGDSLVKKMYQNAPAFKNDDEFVEWLAKTPLEYQPSSTFAYSYAQDLFGPLIKRVVGKSLYQFEKERLFDPLEMKDTAYFVSDKEKQIHFARPASDDLVLGSTLKFVLPTAKFTLPFRAPPFERGAGGLNSTAMDYARFLQMFLNGGKLDNRQILSPKTVAFMTTDQLGDAIPIEEATLQFIPEGYTWGLGFAVRKQLGGAPFLGSKGDYFWYGVTGPSFWIDPQEDMFVLFMSASPKNRDRYRYMLRDMVYGALIK